MFIYTVPVLLFGSAWAAAFLSTSALALVELITKFDITYSSEPGVPAGVFAAIVAVIVS